MNSLSNMGTPIQSATGWQRVKGWAAVFILLSSIIVSGPLIDTVIKARAFVPIADVPPLPGYQQIETLPPPFELHYPGAAKVWIYSLQEHTGVYVVAVFYQREVQGSELVSSENGFLEKDRWRQRSAANVLVGGEYEFRKVVHEAEPQQTVNILTQYRYASLVEATSPVKAKIIGLRDVLMGSNGSVQISILTRGNRLGDETDLNPAWMQALVLKIEDQLAPVR